MGSETDAYSIADMMSVSFTMNHVPLLLLPPHQGWDMVFLFEHSFVTSFLINLISFCLKYVKADVYTVNCGMAFGQAAMLLSLGTKGYRAVQPNSSSMNHIFANF